MSQTVPTSALGRSARVESSWPDRERGHTGRAQELSLLLPPRRYKFLCARAAT